MKNCPRCGTSTRSGWTLCPRCGVFLQSGAAPLAPTGNNRRLMVIAVCAVAILAAAAAGLHFSGSLQREAKAPRTSPMLAETGRGTPSVFDSRGVATAPTLSVAGTSTTAPILNEEGTPMPATMSQTETPPATAPIMSQAAPAPSEVPLLNAAPSTAMPDDVRKWLEHLERIERERQSLAASELSSAVTMLTTLKAEDVTQGLDPNADDSQAEADRRVRQRQNRYADTANTLRRSWEDLGRRFTAISAPTICLDAQGQYRKTLSETGAMMQELISAVRTAAQNPQAALSALTAMQGTSKSRIDAPARATDSDVASICQKYNTPKWFEIKGDVGGGIMSQLGY